MQTELDPRRNQPSASELPRLSKCLASARLSREAKKKGLEPPESEDASSGTRVHAYLHTGDGWDELTMEEQDTAARCEVAEKHLADEWIDDTPVAPITIYREMRLGLTSMGTVVEVTPESKAQFVFTGAGDVFWIFRDRGYAMDFKSLWKPIAPATRHEQLRGLAVLMKLRWKLKSVRVAIIQPKLGKPSVADYDEDALEASREWLMRLLDQAGSGAKEARFPRMGDTGPEPNPGDWCQYCTAKPICGPYNASIASALEPIAPHTLPPAKEKEAIFARAHEMSGDDLAVMLRDPRLKRAMWLAEALKGVVKARLQKDPSGVPGFELVDVQGKRKIEQPLEAWNALQTHLANAEGGSAVAFMRACNPSARRLEEEARKASGKKINKDGSAHKTQYALSGEKAGDLIKTTIGHLITRKVTQAVKAVGEELEFGEEEES